MKHVVWCALPYWTSVVRKGRRSAEQLFLQGRIPLEFEITEERPLPAFTVNDHLKAEELFTLDGQLCREALLCPLDGCSNWLAALQDGRSRHPFSVVGGPVNVAPKPEESIAVSRVVNSRREEAAAILRKIAAKVRLVRHPEFPELFSVMVPAGEPTWQVRNLVDEVVLMPSTEFGTCRAAVFAADDEAAALEWAKEYAGEKGLPFKRLGGPIVCHDPGAVTFDRTADPLRWVALQLVGNPDKVGVGDYAFANEHGFASLEPQVMRAWLRLRSVAKTLAGGDKGAAPEFAQALSDVIVKDAAAGGRKFAWHAEHMWKVPLEAAGIRITSENGLEDETVAALSLG